MSYNILLGFIDKFTYFFNKFWSLNRIEPIKPKFTSKYRLSWWISIEKLFSFCVGPKIQILHIRWDCNLSASDSQWVRCAESYKLHRVHLSSFLNHLYFQSALFHAKSADQDAETSLLNKRSFWFIFQSAAFQFAICISNLGQTHSSNGK